MPTITPDFSEAVEFAPLPNGTYKTRVVGAEIKTSQAGNQYVNWKLSVFGAEGDLEQHNNSSIFHSTMISGRGAGMLKSFVKAATGEEPTGQFDTEALIGREVEVTVETGINPLTGETKRWPDVKGVRPVA